MSNNWYVEHGSANKQRELSLVGLSKDGNFELVINCDPTGNNIAWDNGLSINAKHDGLLNKEDREPHRVTIGTVAPIDLVEAGYWSSRGGFTSPVTGFDQTHVVEAALEHDTKERYLSLDYAVFYNFVHVLMTSLDGSGILQAKIIKTDKTPLFIEWDAAPIRKYKEEIKSACRYHPSGRPN